jgi:hypothetical protein
MELSGRRTSNYEKARMQAAVDALQDGRIRIPLRCAHCESESLVEGERELDGRKTLLCLSCGQRTYEKTAHDERKRKIIAFIREGLDPVKATKERKR